MLTEDFVPAWQSVSPVRIVTFDLGEGRSLKGTVNGEIAIYFCDSSGKVFDILPALQSPAVTLKAMKEAQEFYKKHDGKVTTGNVISYHHAWMKKVAGERYDKLFSEGYVIFSEPDDLVKEKASVLFPESKRGEVKRDSYIRASLDDATMDIRLMTMSKVALIPSRENLGITGEAMTVVEPGGLGYYQWQIDRAFLGSVDPNIAFSSPCSENDQEVRDFSTTLLGWDSKLKTPDEWRDLLFAGIFKQNLKGGEVEYNSESLEAISIIEE